MKQILFLALAAAPMFCADRTWIPAGIRVVSTDEWCATREFCGSRGDHDAVIRLPQDLTQAEARPSTQLLEISGPDAIYIVKRTALRASLQFRPNATARFAVDGHHLLLQLAHERDRTEIMEVRKR